MPRLRHSIYGRFKYILIESKCVVPNPSFFKTDFIDNVKEIEVLIETLILYAD